MRKQSFPDCISDFPVRIFCPVTHQKKKLEPAPRSWVSRRQFCVHRSAIFTTGNMSPFMFPKIGSAPIWRWAQPSFEISSGNPKSFKLSHMDSREDFEGTSNPTLHPSHSKSENCRMYIYIQAESLFSVPQNELFHKYAFGSKNLHPAFCLTQKLCQFSLVNTKFSRPHPPYPLDLGISPYHFVLRK